MYLQITILLIFAVDTTLKLYSLRGEYFYLEDSKVELSGFIYTIFYAIISAFDLTREE
jgi:hypothetical protein